jgi:hypothetical protein
MGEEIKELKKCEKAYRLAVKWYITEEVTEEEYLKEIGYYKDWTPMEIIAKILLIIKEM